MQLVCKNILFTEGIHNVHTCTNTCLEIVSPLVVDNVLSEIGHRPTAMRFFPVRQQCPLCSGRHAAPSLPRRVVDWI